MAGHGYGAYTRGCRCDTCRSAKAAYMRGRRAKKNYGKRRIQYFDGERCIVAVGLAKHGTRYGYEERGCRCPTCRQAHNASDHRTRRAA